MMPSLLSVFERRLQGAISEVPEAMREDIRRELQRLARQDLRATPPRLYFPRDRVRPAYRTQILSTGLLSGERLLEFSHLTIGEYLASLPPLNGAQERDALRRDSAEGSWQHQLEVLPMAHAGTPGELEAALRDAQLKDPDHLVLVLLLRAISYGGALVEQFSAIHGGEVVQEVVRRMTLASGRFGPHERVLMRAFARAAGFLTYVGSGPSVLPQFGEPGAEGWCLAAALGRSVEQRPHNSYWWPTVFHQARALLELSPEDVWLRTRGGDPMERIAAAGALGENDERSELLTARDDIFVLEELRALPRPSQSARHLGMLCHDSDFVRCRVIGLQSPDFWVAPYAQSILEAIIRTDTSPDVRACAVEQLETGRAVPLLLEQLRRIVKPRKSILGGEKLLLARLLQQLADEPAAATEIDALLSGNDGWYVGHDSYRTLCANGSRREILRRRLKSDLPHPDEIQAAQGLPEFVLELRDLVRRFLRDPKGAWLLALAIQGLPPNDTPSREDRLACLCPEHISLTDDAHSMRLIQTTAIASFAEDPDAINIIRPFLQQTEDEELAGAALRAIGRRAEMRELVWKQLRERGEAVGTEAVDIIGADPREAVALREYLEGLPSGEAHSVFTGYLRAQILGALSKHESADWLSRYLEDPAEPVREKAVELLIDEPQAQSALRERVFAEKGTRARARLWRKFASDPKVREELHVRALEDQWEVRRAYFELASDDESRAASLRTFMGALLKDISRSGVLAELLHALARDDEALPQLRALITSPDLRVVTTLMRVLRGDNELRLRARDLLSNSRWLQQFWMNGTRVLHIYFQDDAVAKQIALERVSALDVNIVDLHILLPVLRDFPPALETLRNFTRHADRNVSSAARRALVGDPGVRDELFRELESENRLRRQTAAEILEDVDEAQDRLAAHIGDSDPGVRRIAYAALRRLARPVPDVKRVLTEDRDSSNRLAAVESLLRQTDGDSRTLLRSCVASDFFSEVRELAASGLRRADPALPLREAPDVRDALSAAAHEGHALRRYLGEPSTLSQDDDPSLFRLVVAWAAAKLVSTLPEPAPTPQTDLFMDTSEKLLGESEWKDSPNGMWRIRLAMDASDLPRNRNIWPAANATIAWKIACHLLAKEPRCVVLACADVAFVDVAYPELAPGEVRVGPTFFGFRLREA